MCTRRRCEGGGTLPGEVTESPRRGKETENHNSDIPRKETHDNTYRE